HRELHSFPTRRSSDLLTRRQRVVAIDLTLIPYHGEPMADESELFHSKPRGGTSKFHAYATAYVCEKGFRYTLAVRRVTGGTLMKDRKSTRLNSSHVKI